MHRTWLASAVLAVAATGNAETGESAAPRAHELLASQPIRFEKNLGQSDEQALFLSRGRGHLVFLTRDGAVLSLRAPRASQERGDGGQAGKIDVVRLRFLGANPEPVVEADQPLGGPSHYLIGSDAPQWRTHVPNYARVEYREVYPGIGLAFYGTSERQLEYDFVLEPGADLSRIRIHIEGARRLRVDDEGHLQICTRHGVLVQKAPIVYQDVDGVRRLLPGRYVRRGKREVGFEVDGYDPKERLVVDPILQWSTYLGGSVGDDAQAVVADSSFVYVTGRVFSTDFPITGGALDAMVDSFGDAFLTKFPLAGGAPAYSTYLGGTGSDIGYGLSLDGTGAVVVVGQTNSPDFPRLAPAQGTIGGGVDAFVTKLNTAGLAVFSTYLGGPLTDEAWDVWASSSTYVVGRTASNTGFPITPLAFQGIHGGSTDAFLTRLNASGSNFDFSTYLGGSGSDWALGISMDNSNPGLGCSGSNPCPVIAGHTTSSNFPLQAALFPYTGPPGFTDGFVTKFNALPVTAPPATLAFSTYLGGTGMDQLRDVKVVNSTADVYVVGDSQSADFPVMNAYQSTRRGPSDVVLAGLNRTGSVLQFSTYFGGSDFEQGYGLAYNGVYITISGMTQSTDLPVANPLQATFGGGSNDAFLARFAPQACAVSFSTYLGGISSDIGFDVAPLTSNGLVAAGQAGQGFPTTAAAFQQAYQGGTSDAWVARIDATPQADLSVTKTDSPDPVLAGDDLFYTLTVRNNGPNGTYSVVLIDSLPPGTTFVDATPAGVCSAAGQTVACNLGCMDAGVQTVVTLRVNVAGNPPTLPLSNSATVSSPITNDPPANNSDTETTAVTLNADLQVTKTANPSSTVLVGDQVVYTVTVHNNGPSHAASVVLTDSLPSGVSFVSSTPGPATCTESGGTVTCNYGTVLAGDSKVVDITVQASTSGLWDNVATASTTTVDPDPINASPIITIEVLPPPETLPVLAATSTGGPGVNTGRNLLQWTNPVAGGPYTDLRIRWNKSTTGTSNCAFPTSATGPSDGVFNLPGPPLGGKGSHEHSNLELDTAYCYAAWTVEAGAFYSPTRTLKARPFDTTVGKVRWSYTTGAASLVPAGLSGTGVVAAVSNDHVLHEMLRDGANRGEWPATYHPPAFGAPSQARPAIVPTTLIGGSTRINLVSTQDGRAHAVDADTGLVRWNSPPLGPSLQGAVAAMFTAFGGAFNQAFVATWDAVGDNAFYALDAQTGMPVGSAFTNGGGANGIGISSGGAAVDYASNKVYFTSRRKSPGTPNTVWCMNITAGGLTLDWGLPLGDIDGGPVLRNGRLYVASLNTLYSIDVNALPVPTYYSYTLPAVEDVKGFISTDRNSSKVYFATTNKVWGFDDTGTGFSKLWPEVALPGGGNMPSVALFTRGTPYIYVGGNDGRLYQLDVTSATVTVSPTLASVPVVPPGVPAVVGSPSHDTLATPQLIYVGTDEGVIYAVEVPLP